VESLGNLPDPFLAEILAQPDAMRRAGRALLRQEPAFEAVARRAGGLGLVFTGMGASYDTCYAPVTVLAGHGRNATMVDAAELLHYRRGILDQNTVLVMVSQSGASAEIVALLESLAHTPRPFVVAVTNGTTNPLARGADVVFDTSVGEEAGPSTMTFAATLVVLSALSGVLAGGSARSAVAETNERVTRASSAAATLLDRRDDVLATSTSWLGDRRVITILGRGTARAAAEAAALLLKETAGVAAEALQSGQFRHGPLELAGPELAAAVVATEHQTASLDLGLAEELVNAGASVLVIASGEGTTAGARRISIPEVERGLAPTLAVIPFQLLGWRLAADGGRNPGRLRIASKVTTRE
jgi:glutamine---fructose-6-phosphate transaminase (isomerizing)